MAVKTMWFQLKSFGRFVAFLMGIIVLVFFGQFAQDYFDLDMFRELFKLDSFYFMPQVQSLMMLFFLYYVLIELIVLLFFGWIKGGEIREFGNVWVVFLFSIFCGGVFIAFCLSMGVFAGLIFALISGTMFAVIVCAVLGAFFGIIIGLVSSLVFTIVLCIV